MDGSRSIDATHAILRDRLAQSANARLAAIVADVAASVGDLVSRHAITPQEFQLAMQFAADIGWATDERRNEWVLLCDALGLTIAIERDHLTCPAGATPQTLLGPFFRKGVSVKASGQSLSLDGVGVPLVFAARITDLDGNPVSGAFVDVWHANSKGKFENQDPDSQPEFNLRGKFITDRSGAVSFNTVRPAGYSLPDDGPVAALMTALGLGLRRPAHMQFRIEAAGFQTLVTHVFDKSDPLIDADPLFCVSPELVADFGDLRDAGDHIVNFTFRLARSQPETAPN